ncbi:hypothetical protein BN1723_004544 [Verticillium longisporum]|uniref:Uncharacterized protein n=1 Tax=Verticillium longisporum TaxID=100787 RepID=A0A0G4LP88_VERLO|nr:hypothetical protein HYQ44_006670 [Verticillium longisporum]KAG7148286.1 hypothetical protein HYQ46_002854 [Verticillium longisporum]CRK23535.1 hypothetical protein BN1708_013706 [Verticillium longisporum]CRK39298.1 hypothetical protein BN1723_004544 [Verticillium longisporum]
MAASSSSLPTALRASCEFLLSQQYRIHGIKYEAKSVQCNMSDEIQIYLFPEYTPTGGANSAEIHQSFKSL